MASRRGDMASRRAATAGRGGRVRAAEGEHVDVVGLEGGVEDKFQHHKSTHM